MRSTDALKIARLAAVYKTAFPWRSLTSDPLEAYLIEEAVMSRYEAEEQAHRRREQKRQEARAQARRNLGLKR